MHRRISAIVFSLLFAMLAFAQSPVVNPGFEQGEVGSLPIGWNTSPNASKAGFIVKAVDQDCRKGARCAMLTGAASAPENVFGNLMQSLSAGGYTRRHIRLRGSIRVTGPQTRCQMWLRIDRADNSMAFLENMDRRPVTSSVWNSYDIETDVPEDASRLAFGFMIFGSGSAWVDDVGIEILDEIHPDKIESPRPLTSQGLTNLTAFARIYGYVRFFHPSDEAARIDWDAFAIDGVRTVESAASSAELIERLEKIFQPIAPTVLIYPTGHRPQTPVPPTGPETIRYHHNGVGLPTSSIGTFNIYKSDRQKSSADAQAVPKPFEAELAPGISASVPLVLYVADGHTLPHTKIAEQDHTLYERSAADRATRIADVVIAWNIFQHFYPYFDIAHTDWPSELPKSLRTAATDTGVKDFERTLKLLVAALKDGHGRVTGSNAGPNFQLPVNLDWVGGQLIVARAEVSTSPGVAPGDRILKLDGKPVEDAAAEARALISGATEQWIRYRSLDELSKCDPATRRMNLTIEPFSQPGTNKAVELTCLPRRSKESSYTEARPEKIAELEPGILYVDLDRITEPDWLAVIPRLEKAKGIVFDMRGYPGQPGIQSLAHLTDNGVRSAKWNVASAALPDRLDSPYQESGWDVPPEKPYFTARRVFLTDGRAISYAETVMGIVEHYKLGEIVDGPTAGTNGNVNPFRLPGGYTISWTGMKVLKHDGSQHHGVGILPTVPVSRTRQGVAEGKDEILLRGIEVVKSEGAKIQPR